MIPNFDTLSWPKDIDCDLYLYNGPPKKKSLDVKMVAFTSPNFSWLDSMRKDPNHITLYMPTWTLTELLDAKDVLELNIDEKKLIERYALFGGSARYCLSTSEPFVLQGKEEIASDMTKVYDFDQLRDCFFGTLEPKNVVHRLMHYVPREDPCFANLFPATDLISRMLVERLQIKLNDNRRMLMMWLDGIQKASSFSGFLFESFVHELLMDGGQFEMRQLARNLTSTIDIDRTIGEYTRFKTNINQDWFHKDIYRLPEDQNFPSIDSYILTEKAVLMFQITRSEKHPVKSSGLIDLLRALGKLNDKEGITSLAQLIFVVPMGMGKNYRSQNIVFSPLEEGNLTTIKCDQFPGINSKASQTLKKLGIVNCAQLIAAYNRGNEQVDFVRSIIETWIRNKLSPVELEAIKSIPQYVIEIDYQADSLKL
jgi:hypothetical protein